MHLKRVLILLYDYRSGLETNDVSIRSFDSRKRYLVTVKYETMANEVDVYTSFLSVIASLEGGIHSNSFSRRGKNQTEEIKRFLAAGSKQEKIARDFSTHPYVAIARNFFIV